MLEKIHFANIIISLVLIFEISKYYKKNQTIKFQFIGLLLSLLCLNLYYGVFYDYAFSFVLNVVATFGIIGCTFNIFSLLYHYQINKLFIYILLVLFFLVLSALCIKFYINHGLVEEDFTPFSANPSKLVNVIKTIIFFSAGSILGFLAVKILQKTNKEFYYHRLLKNWIYAFLIISGVALVIQFSSLFNSFYAINSFIIDKLNFGIFVQEFLFFFVLFRPKFLDTNELKYTISDIMELSNKEGVSNVFNKRFFVDKYYLNANATLSNFATLIDRTNEDINSFLLLKYNQNFIDLVNLHRIEHFITLIDQGKHNELTVEHLGSQCGFRTRQSLYLSFKKFKGCSPSDFIDKLNN